MIDSKLYIDGGMVYYGGDKNNDSVAELSKIPQKMHHRIPGLTSIDTWLLWEDLADVHNELSFPAQHANLTKVKLVDTVYPSQ